MGILGDMMFPILLVTILVTKLSAVEVIKLGCWGDTFNRAIPTLEGSDGRLDGAYYYRSNPLEKCAAAAEARGFNVFALQDGGWCASSASAVDTYKRYGASNACAADGEGGGWANEVYQIGIITCTNAFGEEYEGGDSYTDDYGKTCTCKNEGIECLCEGDDVTCLAGSFKWTDQESCVAKCIKHPAYCSSSGDPHYRTFDGKYYDFHGQCTYQAASCGDFAVNFKNIDFYNRAPRYTKRVEVIYKGLTLAISNGYSATVNGQAVQVPYIKTYTNGDKVEIVNYGQLEIILYQYSKGRNPAVRVRASNAGSYVNAEMWLHGSCSELTEGLCGNWNGDSGDDLTGGSPNSLGVLHEQYDESCPAPPEPYHPCDDVPDGHGAAATICDALKGAPFSSCHSTVDFGSSEGGLYRNCMTDVCQCFLDTNCACSQYDNYASTCIDAGVDLSNWRQSIDYCPYDCPEGLTYRAAAAIPSPTCLIKTPEKEGTARGCFCPSGQYLQDGVCVASSECKCLYEGSFYDNGAMIEKPSECKKCSCGNAGEMTCSALSCPDVNCAEGEVLATKDDGCCPYCDADWVVALNPKVSLKEGQDVVLTCQVNALVKRNKISWYKDGVKITNGVANNKLTLKISGVDAEDAGTYECAAEKDGTTGKAKFDVEVVVIDLTFKPKNSNVSCMEGKKVCKIEFSVKKASGEKLDKKSVKICKLKAGVPTNCKNVKGKPKKGKFKITFKKPSLAVAGEYVCVVTQEGKETVSAPVTVTVTAKN